MRICFVAGASSIHTVRWVNAMAARGHDVHLMTMHKGNLNEIDEQVKVHHFKIPAPFGYFLNRFEMNMLLKKIKPDLVHAHYVSGYGTLARLARFRPTLLSVWGSDVYLFPYRSKRNEKTLRKNLAFTNHITATGEALKKQTEQFVRPAEPIKVIPFGIELALFKPKRERSENDEVIYIGTVKGLKAVYGIDILLKSIAQLLTVLRVNNEVDVANRIKIMIVGAGPQLGELQQLANELQISGITEFVGAVPNEQVPHYLNKLDIYCALSRSESFGVAVLEASACEVPVIVSDVGGLPEVVRDGETGYIVNNKIVDEVVDKMYTLVIDSEKREKFGRQGRKFVQEYYDWSRNVLQMESVYKEIIGR